MVWDDGFGIPIVLWLVLTLVEWNTRRNTKLDPDWKGARRRRWRWSRMRREYGRWCHIIHPIEGGPDQTWWEWED